MSQSIIKNPRRVFSPNNIGFINSIEDRVTILEDNEYKITYFTEISNSTGTITIPTGATIMLDQLQGGIDAYVSTIQNGQPTGDFPQTSGGVTVDVSSFDALGNYTLSGTPSSYPIALIYILKIKAKDYSNLIITNILDLESLGYAPITQTNYLQSSRVISGTGVSINGGDNTKFDIQVEGKIVDPDTFVETDISINLTAQTVTNLATQVESYVWIDSTNTVIQSLTPPTLDLFDSIIGYWVLIHSNLTNLNLINLFPMYADGLSVQLHEMLEFDGFRKKKGTNIVSSGTVGTRITHSGGLIIKNGAGNTTKRNTLTLTGATDATFRMRNQDSDEGADTQTLDVDNIDISGVTTALSNNKFGLCKVWKFTTSVIRIQRGQKSYDNYNAAFAGINADTYVDEGNASRNGLHIGWIIFKKGTTWAGGVEGADWKFLDAGSNGGSSSFTPTLQAVYDISLPSAEFTTNATNGALTGKGGTGSDADNVWETKNNAGTITNSISAAGVLTIANQSSDPASPSSGNNSIYPNSLGKLAKKMSNGTVSIYRALIYSDITTSSALTGTTDNTLMKSGLVEGGTYSSGGTDTVKLEARLVKTGIVGTCTHRFYVNTSNSLSGATLLSTQTNNASATFMASTRNGIIKSSTETEFVSPTFSVSGDEMASSTPVTGVSNINIDHSVDQYYIQSAQNASILDSTVSSYLKIFRD